MTELSKEAKKYFAEAGSRGGKATRDKYGKDFLTKISREYWAKHKKQKKSVDN